jgi:hypothetical protein
VQLGDQRELVLDLGTYRVGQTLRIAADHAFIGEVTQPAGRGVIAWHDFVGVFIAQGIEREVAMRCDFEGFFEELGRIELGQAQPASKMLLGIGCQREAEVFDRFAKPRGDQHIMQAAARSQVVMHVARGHQRQAAGVGGLAQAGEQRAVVAARKQLCCKPGACTEALADEAGLLMQSG